MGGSFQDLPENVSPFLAVFFEECSITSVNRSLTFLKHSLIHSKVLFIYHKKITQNYQKLWNTLSFYSHDIY